MSSIAWTKNLSLYSRGYVEMGMATPLMAGALKGRFGQVSPEAELKRPAMGAYICCIGGYMKMVFLLVSPQVAAKMEINHSVANDGIILSTGC